MTTYSGYKKLVGWQLADELAWEVYMLTDKFPKNEVFGLTSQLQRAVLSVPLNIVEGHSRNNRNEFRQFLRISLGSLAEVDYLIDFAHRRKYITDSEFDSVSQKRNTCGRVLWKLMKSQI